MRFAPLALALASALVACGGTAKSTKKADVGPAIDEREAESDAKGALEEIYGSISRGKPDNLFSVVDENVIVFGPRKADGFANRTDAIVALNKVIDLSEAKAVRSRKLAVAVSPGGRSAWAFDVVNVDGTSMAMMAILSSEDDFFRLTAAAIARTPSLRDIRAEAKKVAVVPPGASAPAEVDDEAGGAVERFKKGLLDQQLWGDDLASRSSALVIGPASGEVTRGTKDIKKLWKKRLEAGTRAATAGDIAAHTTADGQLAWVTAAVTRVEKNEEPLPLRVFAVFEKSEVGWKMIALHEALALDEPGAGAEFVKILPPAVKEPEPAKAAEQDKPKQPADKKKKQKKKRSSDDDE
ncbi:MAG: nuclear transport factor 2 family protein [Kofleriaceae bacterium]|nr:nuclear transport factor 2 family protein [Kofleriaceae bacterium]